MKKTRQKVGPIITLWRVIKLLIHFCYGAIKVFLFVANYDDCRKAKALQQWSIKLLKILDINLVIKGIVPNKPNTNTLLISNHISWLDILIIYTVIMPRFVAKKEIKQWFIIGSLVKAGNTIFIDRENKRDIIAVNQKLSEELRQGSCMAVFPEGTTSEGDSILPFKASLFEPIYQSKGNVLPIIIQYRDSVGGINKRPAFIGSMSLLRSVWNVLTCYRLTAVITFGGALNATDYRSRVSLACAAEEEVIKHLEKS